MSCLFPPPLTPDQIEALLDDVADSFVAEHAARCPACAARVAEARQLGQRLAQRLHRWDCPPSQTLTDYHFRLLDPEQETSVSRHAERCPACRAELDRLRVFLAAEARTPAAAVRGEARTHRPTLGEWIARLLPSSPALALRGGVSGPLVAEAGGVTIVLERPARTEAGMQLLGQLAAPEPDVWVGALVQLWQAGELQAMGVVDDLGGFQLESGLPGLAELRFIPVRGASIVWRDLDLTT